MAERPALLSLGFERLAALLRGTGRAQAIFQELRLGIDPFESASLTAGAKARLSAIAAPLPIRIQQRSRAPDGTTKLLLRLEDGASVEMVLIPERDRTTLCVSTQVGCARGCGFCQTATMGLVRQLTVAEVLAQVQTALAECRGSALPKLRNVVFMGMGEPLDNAPTVEAVLSTLVHPRAFAMAPKHLTVSTVAPSPAHVQKMDGWPARFAWSLHTADDAKRAALIRSHRAPVASLAESFAQVCADKKAPLFVEMTLIKDLNDRREDARLAAALFANFPTEVRFNLLPMNPLLPKTGLLDADLAPTTPERATEFQAELRALGHFCMLRRPRGQAARAACGQLAVLQA